MTMWLALIVLLIPPLALPLIVALRSSVDQRLVAFQLAGALTAFVLVAMTFAFDAGSFIDLALCLTFLSVPGTFAMALFYERWL